jgi:hypothetical protein
MLSFENDARSGYLHSLSGIRWPRLRQRAWCREHGSDVLDLHTSAALPVCRPLLLPQVDRETRVEGDASVAALTLSFVKLVVDIAAQGAYLARYLWACAQQQPNDETSI